jgi:Ca2+/H+ antiporter
MRTVAGSILTLLDGSYSAGLEMGACGKHLQRINQKQQQDFQLLLLVCITILVLVYASLA